MSEAASGSSASNIDSAGQEKLKAEAVARARFVREQIPEKGLFAGHTWRISPEPFYLGPKVRKELESLGRVLVRFYRAVNLLYRRSREGKQPAWVASLLDLGKPASLLALQSDEAFKHDIPRVIRPDLLLTEDGLGLIELDSVPGGIGLTAWLNEVYTRAAETNRSSGALPMELAGGAEGMTRGFAGIFEGAGPVQIVVSEEAGTYRPEMEWMAGRLGAERFKVRDTGFMDFAEGDAVYRFFELFDLANVANSGRIFEMARRGGVRLTPPPKMIFEEKLLFGLLWNRNLEAYWRHELGEAFFQRLLRMVPRSWIVDPAPLPPHGAYPEINLTDWHQLKALSKRERDLVLKISGFSEKAWGSRGVHLGSDLSLEDWSAAVDEALQSFGHSPYVLQRYEKPRVVEARHVDFETGTVQSMNGRVRLCPYYFVAGQGDGARAELGGILATICPADKKIIHGMKDAILAPCAF